MLEIMPLADRPGLRLVGTVDLSNRTVLQAALDSLPPHGEEVYVDLAGLDFLDVGGATVLMTKATELRPRRLILDKPPDPVRRMIALLWGSVPTVEAEAS